MYEARGFELDAYIIALEGWRRGLTLRWHVKDDEQFKQMKTWYVDRPGKLYSLSSETKTHYFFRTRGDLVSNEAVELGMDKARANHVLNKNGIQAAEGKGFDPTAPEEELTAYANKLGYPVVLKPIEGSFGRGVHLNINNDEELIEIAQKLRSDKKTEDILIERQYIGTDHRIYVVGDEVVGAIERIPANVTGDGKSTVLELIEQKNNQRKRNPRLVTCLIEVEAELKAFIEKQGVKLATVLAEDQKLFLTDKSNISIGGDSRDVLDDLNDTVKDAVIKAFKAIPDFDHGAIDVIVSDQGEPTILEFNPTAQIGSLVFPMEGKARDIPAKIIDYYFPETKNDQERSPLFFDFYDALEPLNNRVVTQTMVSNPLRGKIYGKHYIVSGDVLNVGYHRGLRKHAFENKISGFIKRREDDRIDVVVMGNDQEIIDNFDQAILDDPDRSTVEAIEVKEWNRPVKVGFEIKADRKLQIVELQAIQDEVKGLASDIDYLDKKITKYHRSFSWRITSPVRAVGYLVKVIKSKKRKK